MSAKAKRAHSTLDRIRRSAERAERTAAEDALRRRPEGNFQIAESYFVNTRRLRRFKQIGHTGHGLRLMYYTALEIYLKAFLRMNNVSSRELATRELGHRYCCLLERAGKFGLTLTDEDNGVLYALSYSDERERIRYIETGTTNWLDLDALDRVCQSIRNIVFVRLRDAALPVRLLAIEPLGEDKS